MTDSKLGLEPRLLPAAPAITTPGRGTTLDGTRPRWTLPAVASWILAHDPSAVLELCEPLLADEIGKGASLLRRSERLDAVTRRALGFGTSPPRSLVRPGAYERYLQRFPGKCPKDATLPVFLSHRKCRERALRQRPEEEKITAAIDAAFRELFDEVAAEKLSAVGYDPETRRLAPILPGYFSRLPRRAWLLASRIGPYERVEIARDQILRRWPEPDEDEHVYEVGSELATTGEQSKQAPAEASKDQGPPLEVDARDEAIPALQGEVDRWHLEVVVPACLAVGLIPSREDEEKAARRIFGRSSAVRTAVRAAREKHLPEQWGRSGPKGLNRKSNNDYRDQVQAVIEQATKTWRPQ